MIVNSILFPISNTFFAKNSLYMIYRQKIELTKVDISAYGTVDNHSSRKINV